MRGIGTFALSVVASIAFVSSGLAADVQLSIRDGRVTLIATDATEEKNLDGDDMPAGSIQRAGRSRSHSSRTARASASRSTLWPSRE